MKKAFFVGILFLALQQIVELRVYTVPQKLATAHKVPQKLRGGVQLVKGYRAPQQNRNNRVSYQNQRVAQPNYRNRIPSQSQRTPRKAFLTWDSEEAAKRATDRLDCELKS